MSITSRLTTMQPERADRVLSVVERIVKGREGVWVRLHSFVVASSIGVSLLAGNRQGACPFMAETAAFWVVLAGVVALLQMLAVATDRVGDRAIAGNTAGIFFGMAAAVTVYQEPLSFVGHCLASLAFWCLMPAIKGLLD